MGQIEPTNDIAPLEKHLTPEQLAESWELSKDTIVRIFASEPGTVVVETSRNGRGRRYRTLRIPLSVAMRVYRRLQIPPQNGRAR
jgi:hypothetical protein